MSDESRVLNVMRRIRCGENVCIAAFGGSITTGYNSEPRNENSWASIVARWWIKKGQENGSEVKFLNEGVSGTDSAWGAARVKSHLLQNEVDLVHLEFAMNDQWLEPKVRRRSYEGVVRQLMDNRETAVIALFVNEKEPPQSSQQKEQQEICQYYGIPFVSWKDCENQVSDQKGLAVPWTEYFDAEENVHPNNKGHSRIAEHIINLLEKMWSDQGQIPNGMPVTKKLPAPLTDSGYQYAEYFTSKNLSPRQNILWENTSPVHPEWLEHGNANAGWSTDKENATLVFRVRCCSVNLLYCESDQFRNAKAWARYPDGTKSEEVILECKNPIRKGYLGWGSRELCAFQTERDLEIFVTCSADENGKGKTANLCGIIATHMNCIGTDE